MAMVKDLKDNLDQLTMHDLVAAIAGDSSARQTLRSGNTEENPRELNLLPPNNEFLVLRVRHDEINNSAAAKP